MRRVIGAALVLGLNVAQAAPSTVVLDFEGLFFLIMIAPVVVLGLITIIMGVFGSPFVELARDAADFLLDPKAYVAVVLGPEAVQ